MKAYLFSMAYRVVYEEEEEGLSIWLIVAVSIQAPQKPVMTGAESHGFFIKHFMEGSNQVIRRTGLVDASDRVV